MSNRSPLRRRQRLGLHAAFAVALLLGAGYYGRLALEPHVALGFDVLHNRVVAHVVAGGPAEEAGLRKGDRLVGFDPAAWRRALAAPSADLRLRVVRDGAVATVELPRPPEPSFAARLAAMPWYRGAVFLVGLAALLIGWFVVVRNPDVEGVVPFALWSASTLLVYGVIGMSLLWTYEMAWLNAAWDVIFNGLFQLFVLHWLLRFPRRLAGPRTPVVLYAAGAVVMLGLMGQLAATGAKPVVALDLRSAVVAVAVIVMSLVHLARAPSTRVRRQVAWVLTAIAVYATVDLLVWEVPSVLGLGPLPSQALVNVIVTASYLVIPSAIAVAVLREGLFGIDRVVTKGLGYGLTLALLGALYVGAAYAAATGLGLGSGAQLPLAEGVLLACLLALAFAPLLWRVERLVGGLFDRRARRDRAVLDAFDAACMAVLDHAALDAALHEAVRAGLGAAVRLDEAGPSGTAASAVTARPAQLDLSAPAGIVLDEALDAALVVPLPEVAGQPGGVLALGPRRDDRRFTDDDLAFLAALGRRWARAAERLQLLRTVHARELELAHTRLRIAADLHDDIGAGLSSLALMSDLAADAAPPETRSRLAAIGRSARRMVDTMRDIVWAIDPASDRLEDLATRMRDVAADLLGGTPCTFVFPPADRLLPLGMDHRRDLFMAYKEMLHNAARHAGADRVEVGLGIEGERLVLTVRDDGCGFDPGAVRPRTGLRSLRVRATRLGGTFSVESAPGSGTTARLTAPLKATPTRE